MRITKAEWIAIAVTSLLIVFAVGYFVGHTSSEPVITAEETASEPSASADSSLTAQPPEEIIQDSSVPEIVSSDFDESKIENGSGLLDINSASELELQTLPGIGAVLAQRIVSYREENGGFTTLEELKNVDGIGDKKFEAIVNLVEVVIDNENSGS